ncbi:MAG: DNA translocase FtsK 4TM domain-containing protein [Gallionella sp.]|nr:DNA translocase FtsK 4TM domain-containing protein [Gallionella sp.]MDD4946288.1 DNA translocase FtsK 4TM domain-containing protein [Gallionella sp.]MDD5612472.1 DNA translocase FtsK 4TM domain-containing protein [Gallionella sp.]
MAEAAGDLPGGKLLSLLREMRWLMLSALAVYFAVAMYGYNPADPAWSHSIAASQIANPAGMLGAYLSDLLYFLFGFSAWWLVLFMLQQVWAGYRSLRADSLFCKRTFWVSVSGFGVLLLASSALESIRLYTLKVALPMAPGGMFGEILGRALTHLLGFTGATLLLLALMAGCFSVFSGLSWLRFMDWLGERIETGYLALRQYWQTHQDKRIGAQAMNERTAVVEVEKKRVVEHQPIHIEMPVVEVVKSARASEEKQITLFAELPDSPLPPLHLLDSEAQQIETVSAETLEFTSRLIERKLNDFGVEVKVVSAYPGPVITRYEIEPAVGVKGSQITNLVKDLARALSVVSIRLVETIPGKAYMALELPNAKRQMVHLSEILSSKVYADMHSMLTIAMGKDISGKPVVADLARMPHVLVAGTTGSGKSVAINAMILSLLYKATPQQVRLMLIDPKMLELSIYEGIPHLLCPVVTDMRQAAAGLNWCVQEMDRRYRLMSHLGVRNIAGYNQQIRDAVKAGESLPNPFSLTPEDPEALEELPLIVVFIDELADLMMVVGKKVEELIARLAQKARASGIHLVLATQRPSVDVITGLIKANVPTRVAFQVSSKIDSRTILDQMGAEALLGQGDMLYLPPGTGYPQRVHGAFVSDQEVHRIVEHLKAQAGPQYIDGVLNSLEESDEGIEGGAPTLNAEADPLYDQAVEIVVKSRRASISLVQRQLRIGYNRAARLVEQMEAAGIVSAMQSNGNRDVIAPNRDS